MPFLLLAQAQAPISEGSTLTLGLLIVVVGSIVAGSVAWGVNLAKISRLEKDMEKSDADRAKLREEAAEDRADVREVRTSLGHISSMLEDIRSAIRGEGRKTG